MASASSSSASTGVFPVASGTESQLIGVIPSVLDSADLAALTGINLHDHSEHLLSLLPTQRVLPPTARPRHQRTPVVCDQCGTIIQHSRNLSRHKETHKQQPEKLQRVKNGDISEEKEKKCELVLLIPVGKCAQCHKRFHVRLVPGKPHTFPLELPVHCDNCAEEPWPQVSRSTK